MHSSQIILCIAGLIGMIVAIFHGVIMQRRMITPIFADTDYPQATRRLVPVLLHFSTFCWFFGGLALICVTLLAGKDVIITTGAFVGVFYGFAAMGNFWGTSGRHPGWVLLAIATALIVFAIVNFPN